MSTMNLFSLEAEHGVIGAMLKRPELVSVLRDGLSADAFAYGDNAELFGLICELDDAGTPVDVITLGDRHPELRSGESTLALAGEIWQNTPSVANAREYARIVRDRAVCRQIVSMADKASEIAQGAGSVEDKLSQVQTLVSGLDSGGADAECGSIGDLLAEHLDVLQERFDRHMAGVTLDGLSTGIPDLDAYTQGLKPGDMVVIAGRPAMGKTTLAMNIAADVAINQGKPVLVVSLEMSKKQLVDRLLAAVGGIPLPALKNGTAADSHGTELAFAVQKLRDSPLVVSDMPVLSMPRIRSMARRQAHRLGGLGLIVIDYLGLVEGDGKNRVDDVTEMSRQIKLLAREMGCPVIPLSQLNRSCESRPDKRPVLSDLRESGAIEQDADIVMFVYRDEVYHPNTDQKGIGEILIRKNRDGEVGTVRTCFEGAKSRFVPLAARHFEERATAYESWD